MEIKILGRGCFKCDQLEKNTKDAIAELGVDAQIIKVNNLNEILEYVSITPGLVVNEKVLSSGKVLTKEEIKKMLEAL